MESHLFNQLRVSGMKIKKNINLLLASIAVVSIVCAKPNTASAGKLEGWIDQTCRLFVGEGQGHLCEGKSGDLLRCMHKDKNFKELKNNSGRGSGSGYGWGAGSRAPKTNNPDIDPDLLDDDGLDDLRDMLEKCMKKVLPPVTKPDPVPTTCQRIMCAAGATAGAIGGALQKCGEGVVEAGKNTGTFIYENGQTITVIAVGAGVIVVACPLVVGAAGGAAVTGLGGAALTGCAAAGVAVCTTPPSGSGSGSGFGRDSGSQVTY